MHLSICQAVTLPRPSALWRRKGCEALLSVSLMLAQAFLFTQGCTQTQHVSNAIFWQRGSAKLRKAVSNRAAGALTGDGVESMTQPDQQHWSV